MLRYSTCIDFNVVLSCDFFWKCTLDCNMSMFSLQSGLISLAIKLACLMQHTIMGRLLLMLSWENCIWTLEGGDVQYFEIGAETGIDDSLMVWLDRGDVRGVVAYNVHCLKLSLSRGLLGLLICWLTWIFGLRWQLKLDLLNKHLIW